MLESGFFENQVWGALHKAWKGYVIAKNKDEYEKMESYARIIQECQYDLRLTVSSFLFTLCALCKLQRTTRVTTTITNKS